MSLPISRREMFRGFGKSTGNHALAESVRMARLSNEAPRIPWDEFLTDVFDWQQGEHTALIGPTGQGKTNTLTQLLPLHPYVVVFATKPKDASMIRLVHDGDYHVMRRWHSLDPHKFPRRVLWPDAMSLESETIQRDVFRDALARIYREGGWTVAIDELWFVNNILGLTREIKTYLLQARALGISLLMATQRPAWVPLEVYDQSTHLFFLRDNDERNLQRLSGISFRSADLIRSVVSDLEKFQLLYINTRTGEMCRTRPPLVT
jgi:energy-coupling factor transporter ATP-binding protein EcfA2